MPTPLSPPPFFPVFLHFAYAFSLLSKIYLFSIVDFVCVDVNSVHYIVPLATMYSTKPTYHLQLSASAPNSALIENKSGKQSVLGALATGALNVQVKLVRCTPYMEA